MKMKKWQETKVGGRRGFSLVELLIAMVILAIGILATMAMQFSSLAAFTSAREMTGATEMARTVEQMIRAESRDWRSEMGGPATADPAYDNQPALIGDMMSAPGNWVQPTEFATPVTLRLNDGQGDDDGVRRFCVYVAGDLMPNEPGMMKVGIAVVYPAANGNFPNVDANNPTGVCPAVGGLDLDASDQRELELQGLRVTRLTSAIKAIDT